MSRGGHTFATHTLELGENGVTIRTDEEAEVGDEVTISLSFAGLVDPFELPAHVLECKLPGGTAELGTWTLSFGEEANECAPLRRIIEAGEPGPAPYRVLVVEDNPMARDVLLLGAKQFFGRGSPAQLSFAESASDAWQQLDRNTFDLLVVDFYLTDGTGDELIRRIRQTPQLAELGIVAASVGGEDAQRATLEAGADFFIDKPLVLRDLFTTIEFLRGLKT